jgi:hypothetical protein
MVASTTVPECYRRSRRVHPPVRFPRPALGPGGRRRAGGAAARRTLGLVATLLAAMPHAALDPAASRGSAGALVDRALQAHRSGEPA